MLNPELLAKDNLTNAELVDHMCNTQVGVGFVNKHMGLPQNTFVSNDAITWLMNNMKSFSTRNDAVERLQVSFFFSSSPLVFVTTEYYINYCFRAIFFFLGHFERRIDLPRVRRFVPSFYRRILFVLFSSMPITD